MSFSSGLTFNGSFVNSSGPKSHSDKLTCTHSSYNDHTKDKCYKLNRYPPGWKFRNKGQGSTPTANQIECQDVASLADTSINSLSPTQVFNNLFRH